MPGREGKGMCSCISLCLFHTLFTLEKLFFWKHKIWKYFSVLVKVLILQNLFSLVPMTAGGLVPACH